MTNKQRILIADDDPALISILTHLLESENYEVISASDGVAALEAARRTMPDLVILDLMMPRLDGFGVLMKLYGDEPRLRAPAIMLTAQSGRDYRDVAASLGAITFVEKPFDNERLLDIVRKTLAIKPRS